MSETTQTSQSLYQALWNSADVLRSKMDANDYKSYLLGMVFYKYLSDKMLFFVAETMEEETESLEEALAVYRKYYEDEETHEDLLAVITDEMSYAIHPDLTFTALVERVNDGSFQLEELAQGFRDIEQSDELYENLFEDIDLYSKKLGATPQKQNQTVAAVMKELAVLDVAGHAGDMLGDAYEYLIGQFATDSGKKAGEFYTPQPVAKLMTQIAFLGREDKQGFTLYDATMGSGSLLLNAKRYSRQPQTVVYFGQELNTSTYNLARMNMILHGVPIENQFLHNADTLDEDWPTQEPTNFDGVLMTDGLEQYHKLERDLAGVKNANCMAHARRHFANAIKAIGKSNPEAVEASVAYKALVRIGAIYNLEGALKNLSAEERLKERQSSIKPLVEEFFTWLRKIQADRSVLPKSETAKGINYCLNQEAYLKVFLSDGEVPIDNLASERALRTFTIGRKNWMTINTVRGADASAIIYSVTETARANGLNVYYYMKHLLTELTRVVRADGSIDEKELEPLMPWSKDLPAECYKRRK